ncbi:hypothetical protein WCLP8_2870012 [uncultured Gammaproteobacteria bacterium]
MRRPPLEFRWIWPCALHPWRGRVGLVLQDPDDQVFAATVAEDVSFGPLNLGLACLALNRTDEAEALFQRVLTINPADAEAANNLVQRWPAVSRLLVQDGD